MLPFRLIRNIKGELTATTCYHNPTFLYGLLEQMMKKKVYNFIWTGIVTTKDKLSDDEKKEARAVLKKKNCYPVFVTLEELEPY